MQASEETNDDFLFIDDSDEDEIVEDAGIDTWKVLIVDDDPEIHSVTQLALSDLIVLGKRLEYIHAYSGRDACHLIEQHDDIVLVLLDVVMETDDAGLSVVKHIRESLARQDIRIVLRTGQPGYAPEESVIKDYDINDYKTKTELTRRKLVTTVYAAIRSYQQIDTVTQNRQGLEKIVGAAAELLELHSVYDYADGVLEQLLPLIDSKSSLFCARGQGIVEGADDLSLYVLGKSGGSPIEKNQKIESIVNPDIQQAIKNCFQQKQHQFSDSHACLYLTSGGYRAVIFLELAGELSDIDKQLAEVYLTNISIGYENVHLFQKLRNAAYKDWLTELPNRLEFVNLLDDFAQSQDSGLVAGLIDINHFSDINDGLGQDLGNQLLMSVTTRMKAFGGPCQFARIGADVFGIIGPQNIVNPDELSRMFDQPFSAGEQHLPISATFGFCEKEDAGPRGVKVLNQINIALNLAKKNNQQHFAYYKQAMEDKTLWRLGMIRQLRTDFADNRLELWYQPQLNLSTGKVTGAEALLRWRTADGNFISPAEFIPLAEYSGLIIEIGDWVINQACQQIKILEQHSYDQVGISVNVSIPQFKRVDFVARIIAAINKHQVHPRKLELEITENILMDEPQVVVEALKELKAEGISIALDDFGTGYSSLSYLKQLPLDRLKVDRSFVNDITKPGESIIADTIINLGKQLDLKVIAEGIEDIDQEMHLKAQNCDEVQGFYYAKPMPADDFLTFLENNK
ncbi:EAL domain-containing protein [Thalassotalea sp. PP2-459]|uniref:bifunctional diguanylate cyclase/phosphodiesterase n=1 Tax=Thalassotalea sp. PP2-459 TaxID=1742724 RepID=UPI00094365E6|nr:EAL domain-containing protein [Thalassotalea sp. PP2-459]OKY27263.1 diguanylate phosphodiesterase [Thalassotalea sp. PP2-459]